MAFRNKHKDPFKEIQACLQKRDYKGALDWFNTLLKKDPKNTQIRLRFADTLVLAGRKNEAVKQFRIVADELAEKGFMIRAIAINKKILQLDPRQTDVHEKLAEMNQERTGASGSRQSLAEALRRPDAPIQRESAPEPPAEPEPPSPPPAAETSPPETIPAPLSELSLEESMAMEFGTGGEPAAEEPVEAPEIEGAEPPVSSGGFELVEEEAVAAPAPEEPPTFTEEPLVLGTGEPEAEPEVELELGLDEGPAESESLDLTGTAETVAETVVEGESGEPGEEMEVVEIEVEAEPEMADDGISALVGALGEDIDSLIDSIIDDVGISAKGETTIEDEAPTHIPLFSDLTTAEFIDVAILLVRRVVKTGEIVVREGEPGDSMFIISTGEVRATVERDGQQVPVATLRDGDFFGEMAVLSGEPRTATVTAVKNTEVLELSRENLQEICSRHPHVEAKIRLAYDARVASDRSR